MTSFTLTPPTNSLTDLAGEALLLVQSLGLQLDDKLPKRVNMPISNQWREVIKQIPPVLQCSSQSCDWK